MKETTSKRVLITSGRSPVTLDLARQLHGAGHQVYVAETMRVHVCRFSNSVTKSFHVPSPRLDSEGFISKLVEIANNEKIDLIIPIYEEILYLARDAHRFPKHCTLFAPSFELLDQVHNKWLFNQKLIEFGMNAPATFLIRNEEDLKKLDRSKTYALKACYSRAALSLKKIKPNDPLPSIKIQPNNPWIAQEWLVGDGYCTYSVCQHGKVLAHGAYPVGFTVDGHGCLAFKSVAKDNIREWVEKFVRETQFTGQIAFDFFELPNGKLYAIECNPRATSGAHLFDPDDRIADAFFNLITKPIYPKPGTHKQLTIGMVMYGWRKRACPNNSLGRFFREVFVRDVIFDPNDLLPLIAQPIIFTAIWFKSLKQQLTLPAFFMYDYEWNGEAPKRGENEEIHKMTSCQQPKNNCGNGRCNRALAAEEIS